MAVKLIFVNFLEKRFQQRPFSLKTYFIAKGVVQTYWSKWSVISLFTWFSSKIRTASQLPSLAARNKGVSSRFVCASRLQPAASKVFTASTLFTAAAQCNADFPWSSRTFTSAWALTSSSTMPSTASLVASIKGVVPSFALKKQPALLNRKWPPPVTGTFNSTAERLLCGQNCNLIISKTSSTWRITDFTWSKAWVAMSLLSTNKQLHTFHNAKGWFPLGVDCRRNVKNLLLFHLVFHATPAIHAQWKPALTISQ